MWETVLALVVIAVIAAFIWKRRSDTRSLKTQANDAFKKVLGGGKDGDGPNAQQ